MTAVVEENNGFDVKFREQMTRMTSPFDRGIMKKNTELILSNMRLLSDQIAKVDPKELVVKNANVLKMVLSDKKAARILLAARKMRKYIVWDNNMIYDLTVHALKNHRIIFGPKGQRWLRRQVESFERFLYS